MDYAEPEALVLPAECALLPPTQTPVTVRSPQSPGCDGSVCECLAMKQCVLPMASFRSYWIAKRQPGVRAVMLSSKPNPLPQSISALLSLCAAPSAQR